MKIPKIVTTAYLALLLLATVGRTDTMEEEDYFGYELSPNGWTHHEFREEAQRCEMGGRRFLMNAWSRQLDDDYKGKKRLDRAGHIYQVARNHFARGYIEQFDPWEIFREFLPR